MSSSRADSAPLWSWMVFLTVLVFIVYSPSLLNDFVWDDHFFVEENPVVQGKAPLLNAWVKPVKFERYSLPMWRPLPLTVYAVLRSIFGADPYFFHFAAMAIHAGVIALLFLWLAGFGASRPLAFVVAAMYAIHPFFTSAVGYVSGMADPLAAFFSLAALLFWKKSVDAFDSGGAASTRWQKQLAAGCLFWLAALCCKEWALLVPLAALISLAPRGSPRFWWSALFAVAFIAGIYACVRGEVFAGANLYPGLSMSWTERLVAAVASFGFYQVAGIFPMNLRMDRYYALTEPEFWRWYAAGLGMMVCWLAVWRRFGGRLLHNGAWRGLLWFLVFWFIQSNLPFVLNAHLAEHWMYFAYLGLAWAAADAWRDLRPELPDAVRQAVVIGVLCLGFFWAGRSFLRQADWQNDYVFFQSNLRAGSDSSRSHKSLALAYARDKRFAEAIPHFIRAVEKDPRDFGARWALARCYFFNGDYMKAATLTSELRSEYPKDIILEGFESHCRKMLAERKSR